MLHKPDLKTIQALARIVRTSDGEVLVKFLESELQSTLEAMIDVQDVGRFQGRARLLKDYVKLLRDAPQLAEKPNRA